MKKALAIILAFSMLFTLFACAKGGVPQTQDETQTAHTGDSPVTEDIWDILTEYFSESPTEQEICSFLCSSAIRAYPLNLPLPC